MAYECVTKNKLFDESVGIVTGLPDLAFTASNSHDVNYGPENCRIGAPKRASKSHSWSAKAVGDSITVDLTSSFIVTGVATQGRGDAAQWITEYAVATSENGVDWVDHGRFVGNFDQNTVCKRKLKHPVAASFVKITTLKHQAHPSMRLDILVYKK
mmetsp:Transcript_59854/g.95164  ORF Transcript_59854/g.95164 Transcript_59854/m.95164 type:complete len:156 (+) Transcript_59854:17-484(+)